MTLPRPQDDRRRIAALFLLPDCDMACRFCASEPDFSVMTFAEAERLLLEFRAHRFESVVFGGGEPLLWPFDIAELGRVARSQGFLVQLCTNGVNLTERIARAAWVDRFILPLEAADPAIHDALRVHPRAHHALVLERIEQLRRAERELTISTVVTSRNLDEIPALVELVRELCRAGVRIHAWHLYRFVPTGRGGRDRMDELSVATDDYAAACAAAKLAGLDFPVYRRPNLLRSSTVEYFWFEGDELHVGSQLEAEAPSAPGGAG